MTIEKAVEKYGNDFLRYFEAEFKVKLPRTGSISKELAEDMKDLWEFVEAQRK
jgi:hypothetical protein